MQTTDFTGTYDYEKEEGNSEAHYICDDFLNGYETAATIDNRVNKTLRHWEACLCAEGYADFKRQFLIVLGDVIGYKKGD